MQLLENLGKYEENNRIEAKVAQGGLPKSIWETYSAFANTSGGVILLGVEELGDHSLHAAGVKDAHKLLDDFWNAANNPQRVSAVVVNDDDVEVGEIDGKTVVAIYVPRAPRKTRPVYLHDNPKHCFRRNNTGDYPCTIEEVRSMMRDAADESQDSKSLQDVRVDELNAETVRAYQRLYRAGHEGHPWADLPTDEFLRVLGAAEYGDDGKLHPTGAGLIRFGEDWRISKEFPDYFLDYRQQLSPKERWQNRVTSQSGDWSGNAFDFYYRAYNLAKQALKVPFKLEGIYRVDDTPAHRALREALANCLTNANYHEPRGVVVLWEPDKITIANPGDFRVDLEQAKRGGESDPRNRNMLRLFAHVDIGERAGSGIPRIIDGWVSCGYDEPTWEVRTDPERTILTLPLTGKEDAAAPTDREPAGTQERGPLGETEQVAVEMARENGRVTARELADGAGVGRTKAKDTLKALAEGGVLVWVGKSVRDPRQYYRLPDGG